MYFSGLIVLAIGWSLCALQIAFANHEKLFMQSQRTRINKKAYTLSQSAGWWIDWVIVTPVIAWLASTNDIIYISVTSIIGLVASVVVWLIVADHCSFQSYDSPEAYAHDGHITIAGILHFVLAAFTTWFAVLYFFGGFQTQPTIVDSVLMLFALDAVIAFRSVKFFSWRWRWSTLDTCRALGGTLTLIALEYVRRVFF